MANHLLNVCRSSASKFKYLQVQLIEKVSVQNDEDIDKVLWEREKYWQAHSNSHSKLKRMLPQLLTQLNYLEPLNIRYFKIKKVKMSHI